jgi:hypothetical protein
VTIGGHEGRILPLGVPLGVRRADGSRSEGPVGCRVVFSTLEFTRIGRNRLDFALGSDGGRVVLRTARGVEADGGAAVVRRGDRVTVTWPRTTARSGSIRFGK